MVFVILEFAEAMSQPIVRSRSSSFTSPKMQMGGSTNESTREAFKYTKPVAGPMIPSGQAKIAVADSQLSLPPPCTPIVTYYYSRKTVDNICYIYRVVRRCKESAGGRDFKCLPEAQGWPEMHITADELKMHFLKLHDDSIFSNSPQESQVLFPSLADLKKWQVGVAVCFSLYNVRTTGLVVGRFVWNGKVPAACSCPTTGVKSKSLTLVLLLQTPTNKLLLSSEVVDLEIEDVEAMTTRGEVYIQGISLLAIVATLIANVTYLAMVNPPKGKEDGPEVLGAIPVTFTFFNSVAFYCSVLSVVVMTAFIPIFGTARQWGAIFLSGSMPVVVSLISFYIAFIISAWAVLDFWVKPLGITLLGCFMVLYVYIWAIQLMHGHIEHDLCIQLHMTPWEWYVKRNGSPPCGALGRCFARIRFLFISISRLFRSSKIRRMSSFTRTLRTREQQAYLLGQ